MYCQVTSLVYSPGQARSSMKPARAPGALVLTALAGAHPWPSSCICAVLSRAHGWSPSTLPASVLLFIFVECPPAHLSQNSVFKAHLPYSFHWL